MAKAHPTQVTSESTQPAKSEVQETPPEPHQQSHVSVLMSGAAGSGDSAATWQRHTSLLRHGEPASSGQNAMFVQRLQHLHGNAHVNRLMQSAAPSPPHSSPVQAAETEHRTGADYPVSPEIASRIQSRQRSGQPLPSDLHQEMSRTFGRNLSTVRVHTDHEADRLNREVHADAFTAGRDIFFRQGHYDPQTPQGKGLLTHELTHVVHNASQGREAPIAEGAPAMAVAPQGSDAMSIFRAPSGTSSGWDFERAIREDSSRASMVKLMRNRFNRSDNAYDLREMAKIHVRELHSDGPRARVERARTLLKIRSLFIIRMLDDTPADAPAELFETPTQVHAGDQGIDKIPPFDQADKWREIVTGAGEFEEAMQISPSRPRPQTLPASPAKPQPLPDENYDPFGKDEVPDEVRAGLETLKATKIGEIEAHLNKYAAKKDVDIRWADSSRSKNSLAERTNHIIYLGSRWIFLLNKHGHVINSQNFAYDMGWVRGPGPGHYYIYHAGVKGTAGMTSTVRLEKGNLQHTTADFQAERYVSGTIPLMSVMKSDLAQGKGVMFIISQKQFKPGRSTGSDWGNLGLALKRSIRYLPMFLKEEINKIRKNPENALGDAALQLVLESVAKNIPVVKAALMALDLPDLAGWLGKMASIAIFAISNEEIEFVSQAIARRAMEEAVQGVISGVGRKGIKTVKSRMKKDGPDTDTPEPSQDQTQPSKPDADAKQRSDPDAKQRPDADAKQLSDAEMKQIESVLKHQGVVLLSRAFDKVATITRKLGRDIHQAGGWRKYIIKLGPDSEAALALEKRRHKIVKWLQAKLGLPERDIQRTGSIKPKSDLDINFTGPHAETDIIKAKRALEAHFGMPWKDVENLLDMSLLADPRRAHIYTDKRLSRKARRRGRRELEAGARMRYLQALATRAKDTPEIRAELQRAAKKWGIDPADVAPKPELAEISLVELRKTMDDLYVLFDRNPSEDLALDIVRLQIELNMRNAEAYYEPGAVRERVTREMGMAKGPMTASEAESDLLAQRAEMYRKLGEAASKEANLKPPSEAESIDGFRARVLAAVAGKYEFSKYAFRFLQMAERLGIKIDQDLKNKAWAIYQQKSVDGIVMGKAELEAYARHVLAVQEIVLESVQKRLRSKRARTNAQLALNHHLRPLLDRIEKLGQYIRDHSEEIDDFLVHTSILQLLNKLDHERERIKARQPQ